MLRAAEKLDTKPVVLDVRNSYEWDAGHFKGAERPLEVCNPLPSPTLHHVAYFQKLCLAPSHTRF